MAEVSEDADPLYAEAWNLETFRMLNGLQGIGLVSGGTAALNEVMERDVDVQIRRTALRPLPTGRMSLLHGSLAGVFLTVGGAVCLGAFTNPLTG